jgi:hypothetical protein
LGLGNPVKNKGSPRKGKRGVSRIEETVIEKILIGRRMVN